MNLVSKLMGAIDWTNEWIGKVLYPAQIAICVVVLIEIVFRDFVGRPTIWCYETTQFLFVFCSLFAACHLHRENAHINADIFYERFPLKWKLIVDLATFPFFLLFIGAMTYFGFGFAYDSLLKLERTGSVWDPPVYFVKFALPLSALLLLLQGIVNIVKQIQLYRGGGDLVPEQKKDPDSV